jgi:hypothetical protein
MFNLFNPLTKLNFSTKREGDSQWQYQQQIKEHILTLKTT